MSNLWSTSKGWNRMHDNNDNDHDTDNDNTIPVGHFLRMARKKRIGNTRKSMVLEKRKTRTKKWSPPPKKMGEGGIEKERSVSTFLCQWVSVRLVCKKFHPTWETVDIHEHIHIHEPHTRTHIPLCLSSSHMENSRWSNGWSGFEEHKFRK